MYGTHDLENVLDVRGQNVPTTLERFIEKEEVLNYTYPFWIIHSKEPKQLYDYLIQNEYFFETFIVSMNEYRIYIGGKY